MTYPAQFNNQRKDARVNAELPVLISVGSQLSLQGHLKDLSLKSAFIRIKNSIYLQTNDEVGFSIFRSANNDKAFIHGLACISRIAVGEGFAIYFTKMDDSSHKHLQKLLDESSSV